MHTACSYKRSSLFFLLLSHSLCSLHLLPHILTALCICRAAHNSIQPTTAVSSKPVSDDLTGGSCPAMANIQKSFHFVCSFTRADGVDHTSWCCADMHNEETQRGLGWQTKDTSIKVYMSSSNKNTDKYKNLKCFSGIYITFFFPFSLSPTHYSFTSGHVALSAGLTVSSEGHCVIPQNEIGMRTGMLY